jgi:hypothetical protein
MVGGKSSGFGALVAVVAGCSGALGIAGGSGALGIAGCSGALGGAEEAPRVASDATPGAPPGDPEEPIGENPGQGSGVDPTEDAGDPSPMQPPDARPPVRDASTAPDAAPPDASSPDAAGPEARPVDPQPSDRPLISALGIREIAVYQAVKIPIVRDGAKVQTRNADVIAGREALVRVFVSPRSGWSPREVLGELRLSSGSGERTFQATLTPNAASTDAALASTLNFEIPADVLSPDTQFSVSLLAKSGDGGGDTSGARHPASGFDTLGARSTGPGLRVMLVPVKYDADGSGRLPDLSATQLENYRQAFYKLFPTRKVELSVRSEPYAWSTAIAPNGGSGWSSLLQGVVRLRQNDRAPKDLYYYGAFNARASLSNWCSGGGCVMGLCGLLRNANDASQRACVGVGYTGAQAAGTAAHEIGHAMGRSHVACRGESGTDANYPYSGGSTGSWGFDLVRRSLVDPARAKDFMSYCSPEFVSDYNYRAFTERMATVASSPFVLSASYAPKRYRFVDVDGEGRLSWGDPITLDEPLFEDPQTVTYTDHDGRVIASVTGHYYAYDDLPGGYLLVPEPPAAAAGLAVDGLRTRFGASTVHPRLLVR